jgi:hypothetical protein
LSHGSDTGCGDGQTVEVPPTIGIVTEHPAEMGYARLATLHGRTISLMLRADTQHLSG